MVLHKDTSYCSGKCAMNGAPELYQAMLHMRKWICVEESNQRLKLIREYESEKGTMSTGGVKRKYGQIEGTEVDKESETPIVIMDVDVDLTSAESKEDDNTSILMKPMGQQLSLMKPIDTNFDELTPDYTLSTTRILSDMKAFHIPMVSMTSAMSEMSEAIRKRGLIDNLTTLTDSDNNRTTSSDNTDTESITTNKTAIDLTDDDNLSMDSGKHLELFSMMKNDSVPSVVEVVLCNNMTIGNGNGDSLISKHSSSTTASTIGDDKDKKLTVSTNPVIPYLHHVADSLPNATTHLLFGESGIGSGLGPGLSGTSELSGPGLAKSPRTSTGGSTPVITVGSPKPPMVLVRTGSGSVGPGLGSGLGVGSYEDVRALVRQNLAEIFTGSLLRSSNKFNNHEVG